MSFTLPFGTGISISCIRTLENLKGDSSQIYIFLITFEDIDEDPWCTNLAGVCQAADFLVALVEVSTANDLEIAMCGVESNAGLTDSILFRRNGPNV